MVQKWNVQCCTCTWYIYVNNKERVRCQKCTMGFLRYKGDVLLCAHPRERERERYYVVHRYIVVCAEVGVKAHQPHPPQKSRQISPLNERGYFVSPFVNGLPSLCYKRKGRAPLWGLPILGVRGIPLRSRVSFRFSSSSSSSSQSVRVFLQPLVRPMRPPLL